MRTAEFLIVRTPLLLQKLNVIPHLIRIEQLVNQGQAAVLDPFGVHPQTHLGHTLQASANKVQINHRMPNLGHASLG